MIPTPNQILTVETLNEALEMFVIVNSNRDQLTDTQLGYLLQCFGEVFARLVGDDA